MSHTKCTRPLSRSIPHVQPRDGICSCMHKSTAYSQSSHVAIPRQVTKYNDESSTGLAPTQQPNQGPSRPRFLQRFPSHMAGHSRANPHPPRYVTPARGKARGGGLNRPCQTEAPFSAFDGETGRVRTTAQRTRKRGKSLFWMHAPPCSPVPALFWGFSWRRHCILDLALPKTVCTLYEEEDESHHAAKSLACTYCCRSLSRYCTPYSSVHDAGGVCTITIIRARLRCHQQTRRKENDKASIERRRCSPLAAIPKGNPSFPAIQSCPCATQ
ncbi:hypothetical protein J3F83DRAFT_737595 [Trichoderma novae-zelandiae]